MKTWSLLIFLVVAISCKNKKSGESETDPNKDRPTITQSDDGKIAELQQLKPYTPEQLQKMLPASINDIPLTTASGDQSSGAAHAKGEYILNDSTSIVLNLFDCAGDEGVGIYNTRYLMQLNIEEGAGRRTIDYEGFRAVVHEDATAHTSSFTWIANKRFFARLDGAGVNDVKKFADDLLD